MSRMKYPIGIQSFSEIRTKGYVYVDKTRFIYRLIDEGKYYFLSRPRRFGKSLLLSTIEAFFKGKRELFSGLYIDTVDWDWEEYPVLHLDLSGKTYTEPDHLDKILSEYLSLLESQFGYNLDGRDPDERMRTVLRTAFEKTGKQVVVLIDEYDEPLLKNINNRELQHIFRQKLQAFYSVLKTMDQYIRFAILTGVTRFGKVSVFSGLNNLSDLSLLPQFNAVCGITEKELSEYFEEGIETLAETECVSTEEIHDLLKKNYDGYHFSEKMEDVYNPFSLLNTFHKERFGSYWFASGTPSFLIYLLKESRFRIPDMEGYRCREELLTGSDVYLTDPIPIFYQSGYLTIKEYDREFKEYILGFPNKEVSEGFVEFLMRSYSHSDDNNIMISRFVRDIREGNANDFMEKLKSFFADIPYDHVKGDKEVHFENVVYVIMKLLGFYVHTEYRTSDGRIDMLIETASYVYVMEFKLDGTAEEALRQIEDKEYSLPFVSSGKKVIRIGVSFSSTKKRISDFRIG